MHVQNHERVQNFCFYPFKKKLKENPGKLTVPISQYQYATFRSFCSAISHFANWDTPQVKEPQKKTKAIGYVPMCVRIMLQTSNQTSINGINFMKADITFQCTDY